jgi:phosphatidylinositol alpha-mannosyltransferase
MFEHAGGVQQVILHLRDGLVKKGHDVQIITPRPAKYQDAPPAGTIMLGTSRRVRAGLGTAGDMAVEVDVDEIDSLLEREKFDVLNFHEPWTPMLTWQMVGRSSAAHVGTFHANLNDSLTAKSIVNVLTPYGRGIGEKMHVITAVSPAAASVLTKKAAEEDVVKDIKYIPNGIDLKIYSPSKEKKPLSGANTKTVLYVGRLERRKGVDHLIRAFGELVREYPDVHLLVAGKGNLDERLKQMVEMAKIPNVAFLGFVSDQEKIRLMRHADLICAPAMYGESFGIVLVEAMAVGTPLIAGRNNGYTSVLKGFGRISLIDSQATSDFAERLNLFLTEESLVRLWQRWARQEIRQYDWRKIVNQYEQSYHEALKIQKKQLNPDGSPINDKKQKKTIHRFFVRRQPR